MVGVHHETRTAETQSEQQVLGGGPSVSDPVIDTIAVGTPILAEEHTEDEQILPSTLGCHGTRPPSTMDGSRLATDTA
jgi:hypothetical protein